MTKTPISLQELRRRIYRKAKSDTDASFLGALRAHHEDARPSRRPTVLPRGTAVPRASIIGSVAEFVGKRAVEKGAPWKSPKAGLSPCA